MRKIREEKRVKSSCFRVSRRRIRCRWHRLISLYDAPGHVIIIPRQGLNKEEEGEENKEDDVKDGDEDR